MFSLKLHPAPCSPITAGKFEDILAVLDIVICSHCSKTIIPGRQVILWHLEQMKLSFNILRGRKNGQTSVDDFSNALFQMKMFWFPLKFHWCLFLWEEMRKVNHVQVPACCQTGDKPLNEPMMSQLTEVYMDSKDPKLIASYVSLRFTNSCEIIKSRYAKMIPYAWILSVKREFG